MSGQYIDLPGVKTWYETEGTGEPALLMHGGMVTNDLWEPQRAPFAAAFQIFLPERRAHGHTPDVEGPLTYEDMATDAIDFLTTVVKEPAHLVGWSDGGNVALLAAIQRSDLVRKLVVIGANFRSGTELGMAEMAAQLTPDNPELAMFKGMYEGYSPDGADHWPTFLSKVKDMWISGPTITVEELGRISAPTLVVASDDDQAPLEHTIELHRAIPNSELAVLPGTSHAALMEKPELGNKVILDFLQNDPVPTMMPIRRAPADAQH